MHHSIKRLLLSIAQLPLLPILALYVFFMSRIRNKAKPAPALPKRIALVIPCDPGIRSGTERAIRDMQEMLELEFDLGVVPIHKLSPAPTPLWRFLAAWIGAVIPLDDAQRRYLGDPAPVLERIKQADVVLIEFCMSAAFLFRGVGLDKPMIIRDHEVLARRFAKEFVAAYGVVNKFTGIVKVVSAWLLTFHLYLLADRIVALTSEDAAWIRRWFPFIGKRVLAIPVSFAVEPKELSEVAARPRDLIYAANFYHRPNVDGLLWLLTECAPFIDPGVTLHLVGLDDPLSAIQLPSTGLNIVRHGHIDDIEHHPIVSGITIALAPIISGGGIRVKNLLFGSFAKAIVTTHLGNEGVDFVPGEEAMVCGRPQEFAAAINQLIKDPQLAVRIGHNARKAVQSRFSHHAILSQYKANLFARDAI